MPRDFPHYLPKFGLRPRVQFRTLEASFGDGYSQRGKDGINNRSDVWQPTFELPLADILVVKRFIDDHGGADAFVWTPPHELSALFRCDTYSGPVQIGRTYYSLQATFDRVFDL